MERIQFIIELLERERVHLVMPFIDIVTHIPAGSFFLLKDFLFTSLTLTLAV